MGVGSGGLEPNAAEMREMVELAVERIVKNLTTLDAQPAADLENVGEVARLVEEPLPEIGKPYGELLDLIFERLITKGYNTASPGTLSYVTGGGLFHSAVADLIAGSLNRYVAYWGSSPGLAQLEQTVVRWFADMVGLPESAGGVLLSGGSVANLSAIVAARRLKLGTDFFRGVIYASDQVHHSIQKATILAGFPEDALRVVESDAKFRIRIDALTDAIAEDRRAGRKPCVLVATAGTTNTGAVDDLSDLAGVAQAHDLWFHVDAAYGGFFALTQRGKAALRGIELADTVVLDPHKSLFLPFGTGCLLARDVEQLRRAHTLHADYIQEAVALGDEAHAINFGDLSAEMSRAFRGLRIWLPMKLLGADAFRRALDEKLDLARFASDQVREMPGFELVASPELAILTFRATSTGLTGEQQDRLNQAILDRINRRGRVHLSPTRLNGRFTLRISVLSFRTHKDVILACLEELQAAVGAERLTAKRT